MKRLNYRIFILCSSLLILGWGCAAGSAKHSLKKESLEQSESDYSAVVLRPSFLKKEGASLIVMPFTAGVGVEANKELERLSLMIVKGAIDTLNKEGTRFKILFAQEADQADFIIQGHITHRINPEARRGWMFRPQEAVLSVESKMTERKSGNLVLIYSRERKAQFLAPSRVPRNGRRAQSKDVIVKEDEMMLAEHLGRDIAEYVLEQVK